MIVDLGREALEHIVKDVVKDMIGRIAGRNRSRKQKGWYHAVKTALNEYQQKFKEDFLPILVDDFSKEIVIKFSGRKMSEEDKKKVKDFMEMVKRSNTRMMLEELVEKIDGIKRNEGNEDMIDKMEEIKKIITEGHQWVLQRLDLHVRSVIKDAMFSKSVERSKIEVMLYNFVEDDIPDSVKKILSNGMDAVPSTRMTKKEVDDRVEEALLEYLQRLGRRRRIGGYTILQASGVQDWIDKVKKMSIDQDTSNFLECLEDSLPGLRAEMDLVYREVDMDSKEELVAKLERDGCVLVMCDKGMGMSLFKLETMREADEALMKQLGAVRVENTKEEVIKSVVEEIKKFELGLTVEQKDYLDGLYGRRHEENRNLRKVRFPFLKSMHKALKMTEERIRNKDLTNLKFRPVVDAKHWLTRGYSEVAMLMMREACDMLIRKGLIREIKPKDGWRFAVEARDYTSEKEYSISVTEDIQEAYTNISDEMIKKAIWNVCKAVGCWGQGMDNTVDKEVDRLSLGQNYAETKEALPMGYKLNCD